MLPHQVPLPVPEDKIKMGLDNMPAVIFCGLHAALASPTLARNTEVRMSWNEALSQSHHLLPPIDP